MRGVLLVVVCALLAALAGCGSGGAKSGGAAKGAFVRGADRICETHARTVIEWLGQPQSGPSWRQQAAQDEGIYEIMRRSIASLEGLGPAPNPGREAFTGYVKTMKARAALYRLTSVAFQHHDTVTALGFEKRVGEIDSQGDAYAHSYGLHICGSGLPDLAKAFDAAGWSQP